jgi:hypothetical protein
MEVLESVEKSAKLKADLIAEVFSGLGADAVNVGELDLVFGVDYLKSLEKKYNFPFISANLVDSNNQPIFKKSVIKTINGKKVGIFGIMGDSNELPEKVKEITKGAVSVADPLAAAAEMVKEMSGKVDYLIALSHGGRDWVIARRAPGIDLIVSGHDKQKTEDPKEADKTLIVEAGEKGQRQGILEVTMDGSKAWKHTFQSLGDDIANPKVKARISKYNDEVTELYAVIDKGTGEKSKDAPAAEKLRLSKCEACHSEQAAKWKTTAHAKAYATLVGKNKQFDPKCLSCHTTRFEKPNGFSVKQQQMELVNVQCESCHGDRSQHLTDFKPSTQKPKIADCVTCHDASRCPTFVKDEPKVMEKIKHWK